MYRKIWLLTLKRVKFLFIISILMYFNGLNKTFSNFSYTFIEILRYVIKVWWNFTTKIMVEDYSILSMKRWSTRRQNLSAIKCSSFHVSFRVHNVWINESVYVQSAETHAHVHLWNNCNFIPSLVDMVYSISIVNYFIVTTLT